VRLGIGDDGIEREVALDVDAVDAVDACGPGQPETDLDDFVAGRFQRAR